MFKKVLVVDDMGSVNQGVFTILDTLGIKDIRQEQYCDGAYLQIKKGLLDGTPYQLLITDLSFRKDHLEQKFESGEDLVQMLRQEHPELKIIVYSIEDRLQRVRRLVRDFHVDAYVCKGRRGLIELAKAINKVYSGEAYVSPQVRQVLSKKMHLDITDYDIKLLRQLSRGLSQDEISAYLKSRHIKPSSVSTIEKRLNRLKIQFKAKNAVHLVSIVKDSGII